MSLIWCVDVRIALVKTIAFIRYDIIRINMRCIHVIMIGDFIASILMAVLGKMDRIAMNLIDEPSATKLIKGDWYTLLLLSRLLFVSRRVS